MISSAMFDARWRPALTRDSEVELPDSAERFTFVDA